MSRLVTAILALVMLLATTLVVVGGGTAVVMNSDDQAEVDGLYPKTESRWLRRAKRGAAITNQRRQERHEECIQRRLLEITVAFRKALSKHELLRLRATSRRRAMLLGVAGIAAFVGAISGMLDGVIALLGTGLVGVGMLSTDDDAVRSRLAALNASFEDRLCTTGGAKSMTLPGGVTVTQREKFPDDGQERWLGTDGITPCKHGFEKTAQDEWKDGDLIPIKVLRGKAGTTGCHADEEPGVDGRHPTGTVPRSISENEMMSTAIPEGGSSATHNIMSEADRSSQQPDTHPEGIAEALEEVHGGTSGIYPIHYDTEGEPDVWIDSARNWTGLSGTGLIGGGKSITAYAENDRGLQEDRVGQGTSKAGTITEMNNGIVFPLTTGYGNSGAVARDKWNSSIPSHLFVDGSAEYGLCDTQDELGVNLVPATLRKMFDVILRVLMKTSIPQTHVEYGDISNPANDEAILVEHWIQAKEHFFAEYGPVRGDKTDLLQVLRDYSLMLGKGGRETPIPHPFKPGETLKQTRDLYVFDAAWMPNERMKKVAKGIITARDLVPFFEGLLRQAFKQIVGSGSMLDPVYDAGNNDTQRKIQVAIRVGLSLPDDYWWGKKRVKGIETMFVAALKIIYKEAVGSSKRLGIKVFVKTNIVDSKNFPTPIVKLSVMTSARQFLDAMLSDVPQLVEQTMIRQSLRVTDDQSYIHLNYEFAKEGVKALRASNDPHKKLLADAAMHVIENHWDKGSKRADGFVGPKYKKKAAAKKATSSGSGGSGGDGGSRAVSDDLSFRGGRNAVTDEQRRRGGR